MIIKNLKAIAEAFGVSLALNEETVNRMSKFTKVINESRKRMAMFPVGSRLFFPSESKWIPIVIKENVYIFPGVPQLFQDLLINCDSLFENGLSRHICEVFTDVFEGGIYLSLSFFFLRTLLLLLFRFC